MKNQWMALFHSISREISTLIERDYFVMGCAEVQVPGVLLAGTTAYVPITAGSSTWTVSTSTVEHCTTRKSKTWSIHSDCLRLECHENKLTTYNSSTYYCSTIRGLLSCPFTPGRELGVVPCRLHSIWFFYNDLSFLVTVRVDKTRVLFYR